MKRNGSKNGGKHHPAAYAHPVLLACLSSAVSILVVLFLRDVGLNDPVVLISLMAIPFLVWLLASGVVSKISAPGGWAVEFSELANEKLVDIEDTVKVLSVGLHPKGYLQELRRVLARNKRGGPVALLYRSRDKNFYDERVFSIYVRTMQNLNANSVLVTMNDREKYAGSVALSALENVELILSNDIDDFRPIDEEQPSRSRTLSLNRFLRGHDCREWEAVPGFGFYGLDEECSVSVALSLMTERGIEHAVLLDKQKVPTSVVFREALIAHALAKLVQNYEG